MMLLFTIMNARKMLDIHSAKNMLAIKDFVFSNLDLVPTEHREVTLMEFKASISNVDRLASKPGRRSEKMLCLQHSIEFTAFDVFLAFIVVNSNMSVRRFFGYPS